MIYFLVLLLMSICAPCTPLAVEEPVRFDGIQLWKVRIEDLQKLSPEGLKDNIYRIYRFDDTHRILAVKKSGVEAIEDYLDDMDVAYTVEAEDFQKVINEENPPQKDIELLQSKNPHNLTWQAYHRMNDIYSYLDYLAETYPSLCSLETIGYSAEGRPIKVIKVSNGNASNKAIWLDGGIHAREWITPASVTYILNDIVLNWNDQPEYIRSLNWYIVPLLNPDGYEYSHSIDRFWRKNRSKSPNSQCVGVDLNRNYGYKWKSSGDECSETYTGPTAFSERESLAQKQFFDKTGEQFAAFVSFHSDIKCILFPWSYTVETIDNYEELQEIGEEAAKVMGRVDHQRYSVGNTARVLRSIAPGSSFDWAKGDLGIKYPYTIELRGYYGFIMPAKHIGKVVEEAKEGTFVFARYAANDV